MDPQWSVIHLRPPMGDRIIPEASHLGQPQEARGSCEWSGQLPNLHREVEKGAGLERATHYRLAFSSNVMGECQSLRRTGFRELEKKKRQNNKQTQVNPPPRQLLSCSVKVLKLLFLMEQDMRTGMTTKRLGF